MPALQEKLKFSFSTAIVKFGNVPTPVIEYVESDDGETVTFGLLIPPSGVYVTVPPPPETTIVASLPVKDGVEIVPLG